MKLSKEYYKKCRRFALDVINTNFDHYKTRSQNNKEAIIEQITYGKIAEWAAYIYVISHGAWCSAPDMEVYEKRNKSFDADLISGRYDIHVKSQTKRSMTQYGASWMFQKNDPLTINPTDRDYLFLVSTKEYIEGLPIEAHIIKHMKAKDALQLYKSPIKKELTTKQTLYLEDLI